VSAPQLVWPAEGLRRVPHQVYVDPALYALEQERIFRGATWNYVALAAELPKPGDFVQSFVGDTAVIVVRAKDGTVNVFVNKCSHRGMQLCQAQHGNTKAFTCPYHQWTFDLGGRLQGIPLRKGANGLGGMPMHFDPAEHGLKALTVTVRNGVVFASFAATPPPFDVYLGEANLQYFDRIFDGRPLQVLGKQRQRISCNWKHIVENIRDPYHATLLHTFFVKFKLWRADQHYVMRLNEDGGCAVQYIRKSTAGPTEVTKETTAHHADVDLADPRLVDALPEFADGSNTMQSIWPNLIVQQTLNSLAMRHAVPVGPGEFELHWTFFGYASDSPEMTACRLRNANLFGPAGLVSADDSEVQRGVDTNTTPASILELGGAGTTDAEGMVNETMVRGFYKCWRKYMALENAAAVVERLPSGRDCDGTHVRLTG
jgi:salicylate 5-hydroxylase large subunit